MNFYSDVRVDQCELKSILKTSENRAFALYMYIYTQREYCCQFFFSFSFFFSQKLKMWVDIRYIECRQRLIVISHSCLRKISKPYDIKFTTRSPLSLPPFFRLQ